MTAYVAFLRRINLGNRRVKMAALAGLFEAMGLGESLQPGQCSTGG